MRLEQLEPPNSNNKGAQATRASKLIIIISRLELRASELIIISGLSNLSFQTYNYGGSSNNFSLQTYNKEKEEKLN
jgi:hypothetical protein